MAPGGGGRQAKRSLSPEEYEYYSEYEYSYSPEPRPRRGGGRDRGGGGGRRGGGGGHRGGDRRRDRDGGRGRSRSPRRGRGGDRGRDAGRSGGGGRDDRDRGRGRDERDRGGGKGRGRGVPPRSPSRDGSPSNAHIWNALIDREKRRVDRDWDEADKIRAELRKDGVEVWDNDRRWEAKDGRQGQRPSHTDEKKSEDRRGGGRKASRGEDRRSGGRGRSATPARSPSRDGSPSNAHIWNKLIDREKHRVDRDWEEADKIRAELRKDGVEVHDNERQWEAKDGRKGQRPRHTDEKKGDDRARSKSLG